ncbi:MAG: hypothetical protein HYX47_13090 [Burkholderiales bacterium]|nr:hypothetical protein [Burkholderiales bacterium]
MATESHEDNDDAARMRQGLSNGVLCASAKVQDALVELGISATPRQLMKAAKQDADVLEVLRGLVEGHCGDDPIRFLRRALESIGTECPDTAGRAAAAADTGTSTFTPIQGDRGAVLRFFNTTTGSGLDLSESETLLFYGVLRGVLQFVCVQSSDGVNRLRASSQNGRVSLVWESGRRVAERLRFQSLPERLAKLLAQSLLKCAPNPDQLLRLDAAALGLAATPQP